MLFGILVWGLLAASARVWSAEADSTQPEMRAYAIPAQDLGSALRMFAFQSHREIFYTADMTRGKRSHEVKGRYDALTALGEVIRDTGLTYTVTASKAIVLESGTTAEATPQPGSVADAQLEEVVVTAGRRQEYLRDIAQSVTALSQESLERTQANDFQDYAKHVPGLQLTTPVPGATQIILRGLSSLTSASTAGLYVDNTPYGSSSGLANGNYLTADLNTFDLQRIEVLRGPQGTLYGASTMGGLLKFVTNPPDPAGFEVKAQLNADRVQGATGFSERGMLNLPLGERSAFRLTAVRNDEPGFISDPARGIKNVNDSISTGGRASWLWRPIDTLSARLTSVAQNNRLEGGNDEDLAIDPATTQPLLPFRPLHGDLQQSRSYGEASTMKYRVHNATVDWQLPWGNLMSATSYGTYRQESLLDLTLLAGLSQKNAFEVRKLTQEVQFTSPAAQRLSWISGLYYTRETASIGQSYTNYVYDGSQLQVDSMFKEIAAFGTVTYEFTPQFDLAIGLRVAHNEQEELQYGSGVFEDFHSGETSSENVLLYSIAPRWKPDPRTTVYARVASGYRPGGPNTIPLGNPDGAPRSYRADTVLSFDSGIKTDLLDRTLSLDVSAFFLQWKDLQLSGVVNTTTVISNAGRAESKGLEWAAQWRPIGGLAIDFTGALTDANLTQSTAPPVPAPDLLGGHSGDPLPYVSKWTGTIGPNYEWHFKEGFIAYVGADWSYVGTRRTDFGSPWGHQLVLPSYSTIDARVGVDVGRWSVEVYGKNLTDQRGATFLGQSASPGGGGMLNPIDFSPSLGSTFLLIRPRTVGLMIATHF